MDNILLFLKVPPPLTGATAINQVVCDNILLKKSFLLKTIRISYKKKIEDVRILSTRKIRTILHTYWNLGRSIIKHKPVFIYFQPSLFGIAFIRDCTYILLIKIFRKPIVMHFHGKGINSEASKSLLLRLLYKWAFSDSYIILLANNLYSDISFICRKKHYVIPNGIKCIDPIQKKKQSNKVRILFLSNLIESKGIWIFLDALSILSNETKKKISVNIIGNEAHITRSELEERIRQYKLHSIVNYLGPKYGDKKNYHLLNSDFLVYPSFNDTFPLVLIEAMQFSLPIITTNEGGIPEIVQDGMQGYIVEKHNVTQTAEKIEYLVENPVLRQKMGKACRKKFLTQYTMNTFEQNMKNVFEDVLMKEKKVDKCP